jgi:hypothetical protein
MSLLLKELFLSRSRRRGFFNRCLLVVNEDLSDEEIGSKDTFRRLSLIFMFFGQNILKYLLKAHYNKGFRYIKNHWYLDKNIKDCA